MEKVIEKNKYIIYNEEGHVLTFISYHDGAKHIAIPSLILKGYDIDSTGKFNEKIRNRLINEDNLVFLGENSYEYPIYSHENGKLKKQILKSIRNYYSYYKEFSKEDYEFIMGLCYENGVLPEFLSFEQLNEICNKRNNKIIDRCMQPSLEELQKRLRFIKY